MKSKTPLILLTLIILAALAFFIVPKFLSGTPYETFSLALNHFAGQGRWTAQSHEFNSINNELIVTGLDLTLPILSTEAVTKSEIKTQPEAETENKPLNRTVKIASIIIRKSLPKNNLEKLLTEGLWSGQTDLSLAKSIKITGLTYNDPSPGASYDLNFDQINLEEATLTPTASGGSKEATSLLKSLHLAKLGYKNFKISAKKGKAEFESIQSTSEIEGLSFNSDVPAEIVALDSSGIAELLASQQAKITISTGFSFKFTNPEEKISGALTLASAAIKNFQALHSIGALTLKDLKFNLTNKETPSVSGALADLSLTGLDISDYLKKILPLLATVGLDPKLVPELWSGLHTLASFFTTPFSLDELALTGLEFEADKIFTLKLAEARATGPYRVGTIPLAQKSYLKGLEITIADNNEEKFNDFFKFAFKHGQFLINAEGDSTYDPKAGILTSRINSFKIKDWLEWSGALKWSGLTPTRLEKLNTVNMDAPYLALMAPDEILGDLALESIDFKIQDNGLTNQILSYLGAQNGNLALAESRNKTIGDLKTLGTAASLYLTNPEDLTNPLITFLEEPQVLKLSLKPIPPLSFKSTQSLENNYTTVLNSLNITISANNQTGSSLKFLKNTPPAQPKAEN